MENLKKEKHFPIDVNYLNISSVTIQEEVENGGGHGTSVAFC